MHQEANHLVPGGYAHFVRSLTVRDTEGNNIPVNDQGDGSWIVKGKLDQPIVMTYEVLLEHETLDWPAGPDEAPYAKEDCIFWTGRALFIGVGAEDITVGFDVPAGWRVSVPWQPLQSQAHVFRVKDNMDLTEAFILAGTHLEYSINVDQAEIVLALGKKLQATAEILRETTKTILIACARFFGDIPKTRKLIVVNKYDRKNSLDGGVVGNSVSMLFGYMPDRENIAQWLPFVAHELFHIWNGIAISFDGQEYWFSEGITKYYDTVIPVRLGLINEQSFFTNLEHSWRTYLEKSGKGSIRAAGEEKFQNHVLIYGGGHLIAVALDIMIRKFTANRNSLDDVLRQMYRTSDKKYTMDDIAGIINTISGNDLGAFFKNYVEGTHELPLRECLSYAGLEAQRMVTVLPVSKYVIHHLLQIRSLSHTEEGLIIHRSQDAGYQDEDRLIAIEGIPVRTFYDIQNAAQNWKPGGRINLTLWRGDKEVMLDLVLGGTGELPVTEPHVEVSILRKLDATQMERAILSGIFGR
jgi:predicted metalloprotease with PDZ domain